jgi:hypothetical protein
MVGKMNELLMGGGLSKGKVGSRTANLAYYSREWRWQDWAERNGYGSLLIERPLGQLRKMVQGVFGDHGITAPLDISIGPKGLGYSEGQLRDGRAVIVINADEKNFWNALHEASHIVCEHKGMDGFDNDHGPGFRKVFSDVLEVFGGIDSVDMDQNPPSRVARAQAGVPSEHGPAVDHRPRAVLAGPAGQDDDGPDQGGRDHYDRRGRGRSASQGAGPREVRPPVRVAAAGPQIAGPLARSFDTYSQQTQQQILSALKAMRTGKVRPDPKTGSLAGFYSIPFGGTVTNSPNRVLLTPEFGQWLAVYAVFDHDYDRAQEVLSAWLESLHRE